jgi:hypothetical protein
MQGEVCVRFTMHVDWGTAVDSALCKPAWPLGPPLLSRAFAAYTATAGAAQPVSTLHIPVSNAHACQAQGCAIPEARKTGDAI